MKRVTSRVTFLSTIIGFSLSAIVAAGNVNASDEKCILDEAIHDYSDDAWGSNEYIATNDGDVYLTSNLLNEATHDYVSEDVASFVNTSDDTEQAEFAAFEKATKPVPWEIISEMAW